MTTILATTSSFGTADPEVIPLLVSKGYSIVTNPFGRKLTEEELSDLILEYTPTGLLAGTEPVTRDVLTKASPQLKIVSRVGVGWDNVDHDAAQELGILVSRTEGILDQPVAELTLGMILNALRHIGRHDRDIRNGVWKKRMGRLLSGKKVGIVGYGAIGRRVAILLDAFGAKPFCADICSIENEPTIQMPLLDLMGEADIITLHACGNNCILGRKELEAAKDGLIIVNTARGELIDETALLEFMQSGKVEYACLDVFNKEPYAGQLASMDNTILTPHIGSYAAEARADMERLSVKNLLRALGHKE